MTIYIHFEVGRIRYSRAGKLSKYKGYWLSRIYLPQTEGQNRYPETVRRSCGWPRRRRLDEQDRFRHNRMKDTRVREKRKECIGGLCLRVEVMENKKKQ